MQINEDGCERCMLTVAYRTLVISMVDSDLPQFGVLFVNELSVHYLRIATTAGAAARRLFWNSSTEVVRLHPNSLCLQEGLNALLLQQIA